MKIKCVRTMTIVLLVLLLLLPSGCGTDAAKTAPELREPAGMERDNIVVGRGEISNISISEGLVLPQIHELSFAAGGMLDDVQVCVGSRVKAGDVLARLDAAMYEQALTSAEEELVYSEAVWELNENMAQLRIDIAGVELEQLKNAGAAETEQKLKKIQIAELENQLEADRALWALEHAEKEENIRKLEEQVAGSVLTAPCDGTVVYSSADEGSYAMPGIGIFWLAEDAKPHISADYVTAEQISKVKRMYATVAGEEVEIEYVPMDRAEYISRSENDEELTSTFRIIDAGAATVENGMSAVVFMVMEQETDALRIPSCALRRDVGGDFVYLVQENGSQIRRNVTRGIYNNAYVQILEGLEEGDVVYAGN